jgi:energy-coupling factor transporter transmembrane protein EcfT
MTKSVDTRGYREYRRIGAAAEKKWVLRDLALIIASVVVVGAGTASGMAFLATPPPVVVLIDVPGAAAT